MKSLTQFLSEARIDHRTEAQNHRNFAVEHLKKQREFEAADIPEHSKQERAGFKKVAAAHEQASKAHHEAFSAHNVEHYMAGYGPGSAAVYTKHANKMTARAQKLESKYDVKVM